MKASVAKPEYVADQRSLNQRRSAEMASVAAALFGRVTRIDFDRIQAEQAAGAAFVASGILHGAGGTMTFQQARDLAAEAALIALRAEREHIAAERSTEV